MFALFINTTLAVSATNHEPCFADGRKQSIAIGAVEHVANAGILEHLPCVCIIISIGTCAKQGD